MPVLFKIFGPFRYFFTFHLFFFPWIFQIFVLSLSLSLSLSLYLFSLF